MTVLTLEQTVVSQVIEALHGVNLIIDANNEVVGGRVQRFEGGRWVTKELDISVLLKIKEEVDKMAEYLGSYL
jgi:hypothetical protein